MAVSVNRQIEADLSNVMGQRDPEAMIRSRSTVPIRASGLVPREQAGHMTASGRQCRNAKKPLPTGGHPHMTCRAKPPHAFAAHHVRHRLTWRGNETEARRAHKPIRAAPA